MCVESYGVYYVLQVRRNVNIDVGNVLFSSQKEPGLIDRCWSQLFASVFKLLAEASTLPVFRMYSWNFVNNIIPHLKQLNKDLVMELECNITSIEDDFIEF